MNDSPAKDNEWFTQHVIVEGDHVIVKVNDKVVNEYTQPEDLKREAGLGKERPRPPARSRCRGTTRRAKSTTARSWSSRCRKQGDVGQDDWQYCTVILAGCVLPAKMTSGVPNNARRFFHMEYRQLGGSGLMVPALSLGTGTFGGGGELFKAWGDTDVAEATRLVDICLEAGLNMFDSADIYSARHGRGDPRPGDQGPPRPGAHLHQGHVPQRRGAERRRLVAPSTSPQPSTPACGGCGTDYIDLFQLHGFDAMTPIEEALDTLDDLVRAGKIRYIGCSNFSGWHLMKSLAVADRYGLAALRRPPGVLLARRPRLRVGADAAGPRPEGVGAVVWSPLGWGRLTGKIRRGQPLPENEPPAKPSSATTSARPCRRRASSTTSSTPSTQVAAETGKTVPQIALNWLLRAAHVSTVIIGARNEEQLRQNLGAVGWKLTPEQIAKLDAASDVTPAYPYWHQRSFERNPPPV